jgi:hypothetical protein
MGHHLWADTLSIVNSLQEHTGALTGLFFCGINGSILITIRYNGSFGSIALD